MDEVKPIDSVALKSILRMEAALGYIHTLSDVEKVIDASPEIELARRQLEWIRTAERKPTAEDANEDGCVLSINMNRGDMNTTNWPWNVVAAFPDCLPVWMPLPKKPDLKNWEGAQNE